MWDIGCAKIRLAVILSRADEFASEADPGPVSACVSAVGSYRGRQPTWNPALSYQQATNAWPLPSSVSQSFCRTLMCCSRLDLYQCMAAHPEISGICPLSPVEATPADRAIESRGINTRLSRNAEVGQFVRSRPMWRALDKRARRGDWSSLCLSSRDDEIPPGHGEIISCAYKSVASCEAAWNGPRPST